MFFLGRCENGSKLKKRFVVQEWSKMERAYTVTYNVCTPFCPLILPPLLFVSPLYSHHSSWNDFRLSPLVFPHCLLFLSSLKLLCLSSPMAFLLPSSLHSSPFHPFPQKKLHFPRNKFSLFVHLHLHLHLGHLPEAFNQSDIL